MIYAVKEALMSIVKYETLLKVTETGNITKAAEQLGYTQPAVSQMLTGLEQELGLTLLNRNKGGVTLTSAGEKLLPYLREAVNWDRKVHEIAADINGIKAGFLRIGVLHSISVHYLPQKLREFGERYPHINFELIQGNYDHIEKWIKDGTVDCGFVCTPTQIPMDTLKLFEDPLYLIAEKNHPFKDKKTVSIDDLRDEHFVLTDVADYDTPVLFKNACFSPKIKYTTENDYATIAMVEQGLGIAIIPDLILQNFGNNLCIRELDVPCYRTLCIGARSFKQLSPLAKAFIDFLHESVK